MTIASIVIPSWISWVAPASEPYQQPIRYSYGLHAHCSSISGACDPFPAYEDCTSSNGTRDFCSLWRTASFLMSLAVILELASVVTIALVLFGGKQRRADGWRPLNVLLACCVAAQVAGMGIIVHLYRTDNERFFDGWVLDKGVWLCIASFATQVLVGAGITATCLVAQEEAGYDLIPDPPRGRRG